MKYAVVLEVLASKDRMVLVRLHMVLSYIHTAQDSVLGFSTLASEHLGSSTTAHKQIFQTH
jgi:hypothetical protein